jgi:hypothetical protein
MLTIATAATTTRTILLTEALQLRQAVFGDRVPLGRFQDHWLTQGFTFNDATSVLPFGFAQAKGGPCGVLAAVQAFTLHELLFGRNDNNNNNNTPAAQRGRVYQATPSSLRNALAAALTRSLWQAGAGRAVTVRLAGGGGAATGASTGTSTGVAGAYTPDGWTESLSVFEHHSQDALRAWFDANLDAFEASGARPSGVVLFMYALLLTRGVSEALADRDDPTSFMIGAHGYCTQELVNLALTGRATSNVFDNERVVDEHTRLRGVRARGVVGFLSLFEHHGYIEVGSHLKTPSTPIWVVCSESHYTVLWSFSAAAPLDTSATAAPLELHYYDELARQDEEIRLTVTPAPARGTHLNPGAEHGIIPPLNLVIRTRWGVGARVDWNGVEPLL